MKLNHNEWNTWIEEAMAAGIATPATIAFVDGEECFMPVDHVLNEKVWDRMMEACFGSRVEPSVENWSLIYEAVKA